MRKCLSRLHELIMDANTKFKKLFYFKICKNMRQLIFSYVFGFETAKCRIETRDKTRYPDTYRCSMNKYVVLALKTKWDCPGTHSDMRCKFGVVINPITGGPLTNHEFFGVTRLRMDYVPNGQYVMQFVLLRSHYRGCNHFDLKYLKWCTATDEKKFYGSLAISTHLVGEPPCRAKHVANGGCLFTKNTWQKSRFYPLISTLSIGRKQCLRFQDEQVEEISSAIEEANYENSKRQRVTGKVVIRRT